MIKATQLTKKYGQATVLNMESLEIPKGQTFGLVGNNGAGKTTFFNLLLDLIQPTTGNITIMRFRLIKVKTGNLLLVHSLMKVF